MNSRLIKSMLMMALIVFCATAAVNGQSAPEPRHEESAAAKKGFKTRLFEIKNRDPKILESLLSGLSSHENGALFNTNRELRTILVRDYPEVIATVEEAINRLDVPETIPVSFDVQLHLIAASRNATERSTGLPSGLDAIIGQLQSTLKYGGYRYITTLMNRVKDDGGVSANGSTDQIFPSSASSGKAFYNYGFNNIKLITDQNGKETIQVHLFRFEVKTPVAIESGPGATRLDYMPFGINTELSMREGEMVVVGTANIGSSDDAIIVVISVKKTK